jgi:hypothetical protein
VGVFDMSIEIFVLSDRRLGTIEEWQKAIDAEGFDLRLDASRPIEELSGYLPAHKGDRLAGFECDHFDPADLLDDAPDIDFGRRWKEMLAFRFGGDFHALWGAFAAAAAYARATGGIVFDGEAGKVLTPDEAAESARSTEPELEKR